MIHVFGHPSDLLAVEERYDRLNIMEGRNIYTFSSGETSEEQGYLASIQLVRPENIGSVYERLSKEVDLHATVIVDNGSTQELFYFVKERNRLITRLVSIQNHCLIDSLNHVKEDKMIRLKDVRTRPDLSEIFFRTSDVAVFNLNAIRLSDQLGCENSQTTGMTIEEACLMAKYIGASDLLSKIYLAGIDTDEDPFGMKSRNIANLLWYMAEGFAMRNIDKPLESEENLRFSVIPDGFNIELDFIKSSQSGRWWVKVPTEDGQMYMACTKEDYDQACQNKLTDRLMKAFKIA